MLKFFKWFDIITYRLNLAHVLATKYLFQKTYHFICHASKTRFFFISLLENFNQSAKKLSVTYNEYNEFMDNLEFFAHYKTTIFSFAWLWSSKLPWQSSLCKPKKFMSRFKFIITEEFLFVQYEICSFQFEFVK